VAISHRLRKGRERGEGCKGPGQQIRRSARIFNHQNSLIGGKGGERELGEPNSNACPGRWLVKGETREGGNSSQDREDGGNIGDYSY